MLQNQWMFSDQRENADTHFVLQISPVFIMHSRRGHSIANAVHFGKEYKEQVCQSITVGPVSSGQHKINRPQHTT